MLWGQKLKKGKEPWKGYQPIPYLCGAHYLSAVTPGQGLCLVPVLVASVDDGIREDSICPWAPKKEHQIKNKIMRSQGWKCVVVTHHRERSQWTWRTQGRFYEGGERWTGPHGKDPCCTGGVGQVCGGSRWRATEAHHPSSSLAFNGGTNPVPRALLSLPSPSFIHGEPGIRVTDILVIPRTAMAPSGVSVSLFCYKSGFKFYSVFQNLPMLMFSRVS